MELNRGSNITVPVLIGTYIHIGSQVMLIVCNSRCTTDVRRFGLR